MRMFAVALLLLVAMASGVRADDWPMYGGDAARSSHSQEKLVNSLSLAWTYHPLHAPMPAWPSSDRQGFDRCFHPVVAGNALYFGSSADGRVLALDVATGQERWSFFTGGPVRFAPALWQDRVLVASDDGFLYCLAANDGKLHWKHRGGGTAPAKAKGKSDGNLWILGNDRLISLWPARGGPVVVDDTVYYGAGIWPSEGIYLHALNIETGKVLWTNDKSGAIYMGQPHGGANAISGVSAQGYLVAAGADLLVPTGRAVPAAFNRADGKFKYFHLQLYGHKGGTSTLAAGDLFVNAGHSFEIKTGNLLDPVGKGAVAVFEKGLLNATDKLVTAYARKPKEKIDRKGNKVAYKGLEKLWTLPAVPGGTSLIVAGQTMISGGDKQVAAVDLTSKKTLWSAEVDGPASGLAAAAGRVFVATDKGTIYCFAPATAGKSNEITAKVEKAPYGKNEPFEGAAAEILKKSGVHEGYCVDLGCGDGALAFALARQSKLHIIAVDPDAEKVAEAQRKLTAAGLYGVRVTVLHADLQQTNLPKFVANLVVSARSTLQGADAALAKEIARLQRPFGGVACLGVPEKLQVNVRGALAGAGSWTHQYADPANTCCSGDTLVKGAQGLLWFRDSDFPMPQRHGRGPAPLFFEGRLIVEGLHGLRAVDAYNGRLLWEYSLPNLLKKYNADHLMGTSGTGSNFCVTGDGIYLAVGNKCLRIDAATGKKLGEFTAPAPDDSPGVWGFLACHDGTLFGSLANTKHVVKYTYQKADMSGQATESNYFFALDALTGKVKWTFTPKHSIRHNAIALGKGRVYLIDRPIAEIDRLGTPKDAAKEHPTGILLSLDAATGKTIWQKDDNIYGTMLALSVPHDVLLMGYQSTRFKLPSELGKGLTGFKASTGERLWNKDSTYLTRPVLIGPTVYAQGGAWDLLTGADRPFNFKRSYGCGQLAASESLFVFRSATLGFFDLAKNQGVEDYGGIRPGCWINAIPAGGIVLVPDATAGCQCSYLNQAWVALQAKEE